MWRIKLEIWMMRWDLIVDLIQPWVPGRMSKYLGTGETCYSRSWPKLSMCTQTFTAKFALNSKKTSYQNYLEGILTFKNWRKIPKRPRPCPYLGKIVSQEPKDLDSSFWYQNVRNRLSWQPCEGIVPNMHSFHTIRGNVSGVFEYFGEMWFFGENDPRTM